MAEKNFEKSKKIFFKIFQPQFSRWPQLPKSYPFFSKFLGFFIKLMYENGVWENMVWYKWGTPSTKFFFSKFFGISKLKNGQFSKANFFFPYYKFFPSLFDGQIVFRFLKSKLKDKIFFLLPYLRKLGSGRVQIGGISKFC